jgi:predicted nucleotidyltransferase
MELVRIDPEAIRDRVVPALAGYPEILAGYLFGSALGECRPDSDIDLGVFVGADLDPRQQQRLEAKLALELPPLAGHPFDLNLIDPEQTILAFRILREGVPLLVRNWEQFDSLTEKISRDYSERGYRYRLALGEIAAEAGRHGN